MNTKIHTGSGHQSVIPYVQYVPVSALLILVNSIEELITGGGGYKVRSIARKSRSLDHENALVG
jgi:hypothetical protein